jgi:spore germination cell wall hydrolase CwlJ-like protein
MRKLFLFLVLSLTIFSGVVHAETIRPEVQCMAEAIYSESRAEPYAGQLAVATVIINRTEDSRYPNTVCGVVRQGTHYSCQFQGLCGKHDTSKYNKSQWETCVDIANHVIYFGKRLESVYKKHGLWFHNRQVDPPWAHTKHRIIVIGGHLFYGDNTQFIVASN